jgi:phospholipid/cholesterol/gamma-HCH transport system substrate-binding protein
VTAAGGRLPEEDRSSRLARTAAVGTVLIAIAAVALLLLDGGGGYQVSATFQNAGQLVKGDQVEVGGRSVGSVTDIQLATDARARVSMKLNANEPLHVGTTATIRATSLSGYANRYVALDLGPDNGPTIGDGGEIKADDTTSIVDIDQLFDTFDHGTRVGLQNLVKGSAEQIQGKSRQASQSLLYLNPALSNSSRVVNEIVSDKPTFERFVSDTSQVVATIAARRGDLAALVGNTNTTAAAIGDENVALGRTLDLLPPTMRNANTTFVNLRSTLDDLTPVVDAAKPATRRLAPFLRDLRPLVHDARPTIHDLRTLIRTPGPGNDLTDLLVLMPRLEALTRGTFPRAVTTMRQALPVVEYVRPYSPDLAGWFTRFGQDASNYDANGHYARIQPIFNAFQVTQTPGGEVLTPSTDRLAGLEVHQSQRCAGGAIQPAPDGSNPWSGPPSQANFDCDPSTTPPGP